MTETGRQPLRCEASGVFLEKKNAIGWLRYEADCQLTLPPLDHKRLPAVESSTTNCHGPGLKLSLGAHLRR